MLDKIMIAFSAYDDCPHRIKRLEATAARLRDDTTDILGMYDHKGILSVSWAQRPTTGDIVAVAESWAQENEIDVDHFVDGKLFLSHSTYV